MDEARATVVEVRAETEGIERDCEAELERMDEECAQLRLEQENATTRVKELEAAAAQQTAARRSEQATILSLTADLARAESTQEATTNAMLEATDGRSMQHEAELATLQSTHEYKLHDREAAHQRALAVMRTEQLSATDSLKARHESSVQGLRAQHERQLEEQSELVDSLKQDRIDQERSLAAHRLEMDASERLAVRLKEVEAAAAAAGDAHESELSEAVSQVDELTEEVRAARQAREASDVMAAEAKHHLKLSRSAVEAQSVQRDQLAAEIERLTALIDSQVSGAGVGVTRSSVLPGYQRLRTTY